MGIAKLASGLAAIVLGHTAYVFFVYRARVLTHSAASIVRFHSVRSACASCVRWFLLAAAQAKDAPAADVGRCFSPDSAVALPQPVAPLQHVWNLVQRLYCMEHDHLTNRWSEPPPAVHLHNKKPFTAIQARSRQRSLISVSLAL